MIIGLSISKNVHADVLNETTEGIVTPTVKITTDKMKKIPKAVVKFTKTKMELNIIFY